VPPSVAPGTQMRSMAPAVTRKSRGDFGNMQAEQARLHDHFAGKFHACGAKIHPPQAVLAEGAHAAVKIAAGSPEKESADPSKQGIANIAMQKGHGIVTDAAMESIAHDEVGARS
jgi:hypothetical protein